MNMEKEMVVFCAGGDVTREIMMLMYSCPERVIPKSFPVFSLKLEDGTHFTHFRLWTASCKIY